jgi:hypothetical protein
MRDSRLQLVVPENSATATTDGPELSAPPVMSDAIMRRLRTVDAGEGVPPDDAA